MSPCNDRNGDRKEMKNPRPYGDETQHLQMSPTEDEVTSNALPKEVTLFIINSAKYEADCYQPILI